MQFQLISPLPLLRALRGFLPADDALLPSETWCRRSVRPMGLLRLDIGTLFLDSGHP